MAFLSHLRPNNKSKKPITKRKTPMGIKVTKATPRVAIITASVATAANAPAIELRQLTVIPATSTSVNASTNSTDAARNAAITIAHCISFFSFHSIGRSFSPPFCVHGTEHSVPLHHRSQHRAGDACRNASNKQSCHAPRFVSPRLLWEKHKQE